MKLLVSCLRRRKRMTNSFLLILPAVLLSLYEEKRPEHTSSLSGAKKVEEILDDHENWCKADYRMEPEVFRAVASLLREEGLLRDTRGGKVEEQLAMFMFMLSHDASTGRLKKEFQHSSETIHRKINEVFDTVPALTAFSIAKCLDEVDAMDGLTDEDKSYAMNVFESETNRELFMTSKNHNA